MENEVSDEYGLQRNFVWGMILLVVICPNVIQFHSEWKEGKGRKVNVENFNSRKSAFTFVDSILVIKSINSMNTESNSAEPIQESKFSDLLAHVHRVSIPFMIRTFWYARYVTERFIIPFPLIYSELE